MSIDVEERKVTVVGNVSPDILIKKLIKAGKHAELLSAKGGGGGGKGQSLTSQLQKLQFDHQLKEHGKTQKEGGGGGGKEQKGQPVPQTQLQEGKGFKDLKFLNFKDLKIPFKKDSHKAAVKLDLPSKEQLDDGNDFDDEEDDYDEFDDDDEDLDDMDEYSDEEPYEKPKMMKPSNLQPKGSAVAKDKKGGGGDKGGEGSKKGNGGDGAHDNKNGGGNNNNIKGGNNINNAGNHAHSGKSSSNKGGGSNNNVGGGLPIGQPHMMGQFGNMQPPTGLMATNNAQALPAGAYFPPEMMAGPNPYQQQYLQSLMQQQRMMMNGQDRPTGYGYGPPPMYGPQQHPYSMFSDENLNGCLIM